jgi:phosphoserine phosphatase
MPTLPQSRVLHIDITGHDAPGVTHALTSILARSGARILDIGQAVIHDALALGMLVELTDEMKSSSLLTELLLEAHELGVQIRFSAITGDEYESWVGAQGKGRYLVSVLGPALTAAHLAEVSGPSRRRASTSIASTGCLGARRSTPPPATRVCVELAASGDRSERGRDARRAAGADPPARHRHRVPARQRLSTQSAAGGVRHGLDAHPCTEVIDELAKLAGVGEQVQAITEAAMRGELDFQASFRQRVALLKGLPASALQQVVETVPLMDGAERLTSTLRRLGYKTAILSGGFTFVGRELQQRLGIDYLHANELDIAGGAVTGEVRGEIVDGARKAHYLTEIARAEGLDMEQVIAVGDGANDLPMLRLAGLGIAFRAKPLVRQSARQSISTWGSTASST